MPQQANNKKPRSPKKPAWQKGAYARQQQLSFNFRIPFLMLCNIWGITPEQVLNDFIDNLSHTHHFSTGRCKAKQQLRNYIIEMGYGQQHFLPQAIEQQLTQLNAAGQVYPTGGGNFLPQHINWLQGYYNWWYSTWQAKTVAGKK